MEEDLIRRVKQGDEAAFDNLINLHREVLFRYAYLIVGAAHVAEDVTQEAVLRIYKNIQRFDERYSFRPWALRITRNMARNHNRAWGRYKNMLKRLINSQHPDPIDVEALSHAQQQARLLHDAVRQLKADYQDVIYARFFLDLSVEECAAVLGIAEGTVKSRSHRALKQLKSLIEQQFPQLKQEVSHE